MSKEEIKKIITERNEPDRVVDWNFIYDSEYEDELICVKVIVITPYHNAYRITYWVTDMGVELVDNSVQSLR